MWPAAESVEISTPVTLDVRSRWYSKAGQEKKMSKKALSLRHAKISITVKIKKMKYFTIILNICHN